MEGKTLDLFKDFIPGELSLLISLVRDERGTKKRISEGMKRYINGLSPEELKVHLSRSIHSPKAFGASKRSRNTPEFRARQSIVTSVNQSIFWASLPSNEKKKRVEASIHNPEARKAAQETLRWLGKNMPDSKKSSMRKKVSIGQEKSWGKLGPKERLERMELGLLSKRGRRRHKEFFDNMTKKERLEWARGSFLSDEGILNSRRGASRRPTIPESCLGTYLTKTFPGKFKYNGDGSQHIIIGGKIPDFVDKDNKRVVECFGSFYHDLLYFPTRLSDDELVELYRNYGYDCVVIWEDDCYLDDKLDELFSRWISN